ncbi:MAG: hypothetical protein H0V82_11655 [Candidatus Protochlamydia sp.]|nr:hypothetical protein [Candidatus Protochlamydia sp.]
MEHPSEYGKPFTELPKGSSLRIANLNNNLTKRLMQKVLWNEFTDLRQIIQPIPICPFQLTEHMFYFLTIRSIIEVILYFEKFLQSYSNSHFFMSLVKKPLSMP